MTFDEEDFYGFTIAVRLTGVQTDADDWSLIGSQSAGLMLVLIINFKNNFKYAVK